MKKNHHNKNKRGFSLVELMVVMVILISMFGLVVTASQASKNQNTASTVVSLVAEIERHKQAAASSNRTVWTYIGPSEADSSILTIQAWETNDGSATLTDQNRKRSSRALRWKNVSLSDADFSQTKRADVAADARMRRALWLRFSPSGEVHAVAASENSELSMPPTVADDLQTWWEFAIVPTQRGKVTQKLLDQHAIVQISGLTGQSRWFMP